MVKEIQTLEEFKALVEKAEAGKLVVVDFWATWCGPCVRIAPVVKMLAEQHTDVLFFKVDVDGNSETSEYLEISAMPTFKFYKNGKVVGTVEGGNRQKIIAAIRKYK